MSRSSKWPWFALLAYSIARFIHSAGVSAWTIVGGDFASAFPSIFTLRVSEMSPWLHRDWIAEGMPRHVGGLTLWNYGPVLHLITVPLALAPTHLAAARLLLVVDYVLVAATFVMWLRLLFPRQVPTVTAIAILCIWLNHYPLVEAVTGRELEIFELFLITLAIHALKKDQDIRAGIMVGVAAMTKFLPVIFIPYLYVKGYRRGAVAGSIVIAALALFAQLALGWDQSLTVIMAKKEAAAAPSSYTYQAITNVLYKTFTAFDINEPSPPTLYPGPLRAIGTALNVLVMLATAWFILRWRRLRLLEEECALLLIVMCLLPVHSNTYYLVFALPAIAIATAAWREGRLEGRSWTVPALAASIALMGLLLPMKAYEVVTGVPGMLIARALQGWSLPFYGAILAAGLMVEVHRIRRQTQ